MLAPLGPGPRDATPGGLLLAGLAWFGMYNVVLNEAEQRVDAGTAAMVVNVGPLFILAFAAMFLNERLTSNVLLGAGIAFTGVIAIGLANSSGKASALGVALCLIAALGYAIGVVVQKPLLSRLPAIQLTWICCTIEARSCLAFAPALVEDLGHAPVPATAWTVYLAAFPTAIAFATRVLALARTTATRIAATIYLVPPLAVGLSWVLLGEIPQPLGIVGGVVCLVGVYVARRTPRAIEPVIIDLEELPAAAEDRE